MFASFVIVSYFDVTVCNTARECRPRFSSLAICNMGLGRVYMKIMNSKSYNLNLIIVVFLLENNSLMEAVASCLKSKRFTTYECLKLVLVCIKSKSKGDLFNEVSAGYLINPVFKMGTNIRR